MKNNYLLETEDFVALKKEIEKLIKSNKDINFTKISNVIITETILAIIFKAFFMVALLSIHEVFHPEASISDPVGQKTLKRTTKSYNFMSFMSKF